LSDREKEEQAKDKRWEILRERHCASFCRLVTVEKTFPGKSGSLIQACSLTSKHGLSERAGRRRYGIDIAWLMGCRLSLVQ